MDNNFSTVYNVFVASTLCIRDHREAVKKAIGEANDDRKVQSKGVRFDEFLYEDRPDFTQKLEKRDAQEPVDRILRRSPIFILIVDDVIRNLTRYEFEVALERFEEGQMPRYLFLCHKKDGTTVQTTVDGMSFDEFFKKYNLNSYQSDRHGETITHRRVYDIPFDGLEDGPESLKAMVKGQLMRLVESDEMAFPHAVLGWQLDETRFFGNDTLRKEKYSNVYYRRNVDDDLDLALKTDSVVLLVGESLAGKTRAAMEALKSVDDGWVYVPDRGGTERKPTIEEQVATIESLVRYFSRKNPQKLYVFFDDIGLMARGDEKVQLALSELVKAVQGAHGKGVLLATSSSSDVGVEGLTKDSNGVRELHIGTMSDNDIDMAVRYFTSCGLTISHDSLLYRMMGALFVNLDQLKVRYDNYLHGSDLGSFIKKEIKELFCVVRGMLLQSIKAQSIWRDDLFGNLDMLVGMVRYLFSLQYVADDEQLDRALKNAVEALCQDGALGVSKGSDRMLDVQEYVYKYFIGYAGEKLDKPYEEEVGKKAERKAVQDILMFCSSKDYYIADEPLTWNLSRISSRCVYGAATVGWLYSLWSGKAPVGEVGQYATLAQLLHDDRGRLESTPVQELSPKTLHHFSKVVEVYIYRCCNTFDESFEAYESCVPSMRTGHLLRALMSKASSSADRERLRGLADYETFRDDPYVVRSEVEWAETYDEAAAIMTRFDSGENIAHAIDRILSAKELQYDIIQLTRAANTLISKISTEDEFFRCIDLLRPFYVKMTDDYCVLQRIKEKGTKETIDGLTMIDIMARINTYSLGQGLERVYGGNVDASRSLIETMKATVKATLQARITSETEVRVLFGFVGSWLVKWAAEEGCSYDEAYDTLFSALHMPHPLRDGKCLVLRNSYTYTSIMMCNDCGIERALNLFENDLVSHVADRLNPIVVNRYTLNVLLKKCSKKTSDYLARVAKLFSQLDVRRDAFSYYSILKGAKYNDEGKKDNGIDMATCKTVINEMKKDKVEHNIFTITALMSCKDADLAMALGFVNPPAEVLADYHTKPFPEFTASAELKRVVKTSDEAWASVFRKRCPTQAEKELFGRCLDYVEMSYGPSVLNSGKVYNAIVSNRDYMPDIASALKFVREKIKRGFFVPDSYTACILLDKVTGENGRAKREALYLFNGFLKENLRLIDTYVINKRIDIYKSYIEQWPQVFVDADGNIIEREMEAMRYVETMQELGFKMEYFTVKEITRFEMGELSDKLKNRLMNVLIKQQERYPIDSQMSEVLRERIGVDALKKNEGLHLAQESALSHNKNVTYRFKRKAIDINTALMTLNWNDANSAGIEFNTIMTDYINRFTKKDTSLFMGVMGYYRMFYGHGCGRRPSSYTFGVIVKAVSSLDDFKTVMAELMDKRKTNPRLSLQPIMLARLVAVVRRVDDLAKETCKFKAAGGEYDRNTADIYLNKLAHYFYKKDKEHTQSLLDDVFRFIILGGDAKEALVLNERKHLLMDLYADPANIQPNTLHTIIKYNRQLTQPMDCDQIVDSIKNKYPKCIPGLMNLVVGEGGWVVEKYLFPLFSSLQPHSSPKLDRGVLASLVARLPQFDIAAYNSFVRQLYVTDCRDVEAVVPGLVRCIHRMSKKKVTDVDLLTAVRRTEAQMVTYSELGILRLGHLLIEKAPAEYGDWCRHSMQSDAVYQSLNSIETLTKDRKNLAEKLKYSVSLLDDAFPCALMVLGKCRTDTPTDTETVKVIERLQRSYNKKIAAREVGFRHLQRLPLLWQRASWTPSVEHVLTLVAAYAGRVAEDYYPERIDAIIERLVASVVSADNRHSSEVLVRYGTIGHFKHENRAGRMVPIGELAAVMYEALLHYLASHLNERNEYTSRLKKGFAVVERQFARHIGGTGKVDYKTLLDFPSLWEKAHLSPSLEVVVSMVKYFKKVEITHGPNYEDARRRLRQVRCQVQYASQKHFLKVRITYAMLGNCDAECTSFVLVKPDKLA